MSIAATPASNSAVVHEGTITKRGNNWRSWKERLFCINDKGVLSYYELDNGVRSLKGTIDIQECTAILTAHKAAIKWPVEQLPEASDPACCMAIVLPHRTFYFVARNPCFAEMWRTVFHGLGSKITEIMDVPISGPMANIEEVVLRLIPDLTAVLRNATDYTDPAQIQTISEALSALRYCAEISERAKNGVAMPDTLSALVKALVTLPEADPARSAVVHLLSLLSHSSELRKNAICQFQPYKLKEILLLGTNASERANAASILIDLLTGNADRVNRVLDEGGIDIVTQLLQHTSDTNRAHTAAIALEHCCTPHRIQFFFAAGAVNALVPLLRSQQPLLVRRVVSLLSHLAGGENAAPRVDAILSCNGHDKLVALLKSESEELCCDAAATIWNLAQFVPIENLPHYRTFTEAIPSLVPLLGSPSLDVQLSGCGALASIARLSDFHRNEIVRTPNTLPAIVRMVSSPDPRISFEAARTINNLADGEKDRMQRASALVAADTVTPLAWLLRTRSEDWKSEDETLCCAALDSLLNLAWAGDGPCNAIIKAGMAKPLLFFLAGPSTTARRAAQCVRNLCAFTDRQPRAFELVRAGVIAPLVTLLNPDNAETCVQAAAALRNMANGDKLTDPALRLAIAGDERTVTGLSRLVNALNMRASVQAINALSNLALSDCVRPFLRRGNVHLLCRSDDAMAVARGDPDAYHVLGLLSSSLSEPTPGNQFEPTDPYAVLLYAEDDAAPVRALADTLAGAGVRLWSQPPSANLEPTAAVSSELCLCVIIACSQSCLASLALRASTEYAHRAGNSVIGVIVEAGFVSTGWLSNNLGLAQTFDTSTPTATSLAVPAILSLLPESVRHPITTTTTTTTIATTKATAAEMSPSIVVADALTSA